ncbi:unnamed protein product [Closterium sp. NIES-54]
MQSCLSRADELEALVELYAGLQRMPALQENKALPEAAEKLPPGVSPQAVAFTKRALLTLQPELEELRSQIDALLEKGFIQAITSPFAALILFTPKKDGGLRMCIDYRALNRVTIKSRYPIPRTDDLLDRIRGAHYFSKIDLHSGYHRIRVFADDCHKTAFRTRYGSYEFTMMPFGLTNAPLTFKLTMNRVFRDLLDRCVIVYLDDILIFSKTRAQHLRDLDAIFKRLQENQLITKSSKCEFFKQELEFLGHVISRDGIKIDPAKIKTIQEWKSPTNITELQSFLGFVNYVRRFIPNMAGITGPLTDLLHKDRHFVWGEEAEAAFQELKHFLVSPLVLRIADQSRPAVVRAVPAPCAILAPPHTFLTRGPPQSFPLALSGCLTALAPRQRFLSRASWSQFTLPHFPESSTSWSPSSTWSLRVPPDPGTVAAALGASVAAALGANASVAPGAGASPPSGTAPTKSFHTFTLDSGASRSFFRDSTTLTPLRWPVAVSLADPSGGPVLAHSSTVLSCPAALSGLLSGLHLPSFSTNLVSGADLQDAWVDQFTPGGQRVTHCTCSRTGRHLATFTRRPGSSLYTLTTAPPPVPASGQVAASSQVFAAASRSSPASAPCSCRPLAHETLLWHHRLGHPSLPRLQGMASRALVSGLPRSLPPEQHKGASGRNERNYRWALKT